MEQDPKDRGRVRVWNVGPAGADKEDAAAARAGDKVPVKEKDKARGKVPVKEKDEAGGKVPVRPLVRANAKDQSKHIDVGRWIPVRSWYQASRNKKRVSSNKKGGQTMPGLNQTGPAGMGPMTGRGRGVCSTGRAAYSSGNSENLGFGRGMGFGRGCRRGFGAQMNVFPGQGMGRNRRAYFEDYSGDAQSELGRLKNEAQSMQRALETINERITEMEKNQ